MFGWCHYWWLWFWSLDQVGVSKIQVLATAALTATSIIIALFVARATWLNYFGWKPNIAVIKRSVHKFDAGRPAYGFVIIVFEVWNRRKYNILIRLAAAQVRWSDVIGISPDGLKRIQADKELKEEHEKWNFFREQALCEADVLVGPGKYRRFATAILLEKDEDTSPPAPEVEVRALFYDYRKDKDYVIVSNSLRQDERIRKQRKKWGWPADNDDLMEAEGSG